MAVNEAVAQMLDEWAAARLVIRELAEEAHPDVVDALGRTWTWRNLDLYAHDGMAWPLAFITNPNISKPRQSALDNPNYRWCEICKS